MYVAVTMPTLPAVRKVVVIGAGASCLCALRHFSADPNYDVVAYEAASTLGGIWNYISAPSTHSLKPILKNHPSTDSTPFAESFGPLAITTIVSRENMSGYLNDYAAHYDLMQYFKFRHQILSLNPLNNENHPHKPQFMVTVVDLETEISEEIIADIVLLCTGHDTKPYQPSLHNIDAFQGIVTHSSEYSGPETYKNLRVVVMGHTSIANEIVCELLSVTKKVIFVPVPQAQDEHYYSPGGFSFDFDKFLTDTMPGKVLSCLLESVKSFCCSTSTTQQFDVPEMFTEILQTHSIVTFKEESVVLPNGKNERIDAVILATGFDYDFPFLTPECQTEVSPGRVSPLYRQLIHSRLHTLAFVGLHNVVPYLVTGTEMQIRFYKAFLDGKITLPSVDEMLEADTAEEYCKLYWAHKMVKQVWPYTVAPTCAAAGESDSKADSGEETTPRRTENTLTVEACSISPDRISQQFSSSLVRRISPLPGKLNKEIKRRSSAKIVQFKVGDKVLRKSLSFSGSIAGSPNCTEDQEGLSG
ncbi:uncharacterized protein LOC129584733 [Paramacrobiotus metropolitanus]|uniref:uncharacterized protein LOC129584733 n=1 Tax=Paramacrobiotus metropolitanus TaxID=2943436 RepID=UPI002445E227|nr:uncharacterized protein LOC129584733 [Paramacrobiotus metropolitanus]